MIKKLVNRLAKAILILLCSFNLQFLYGQAEDVKSCKIEIYLLNKVLPGIDTGNKSCDSFFASTNDLQDIPLIADSEILSFAILRDTVKKSDSVQIVKTYVFEVLESAPKKINSLDSPLYGGRQFAIVANKSIVYCGYFWNSKSVLKWNWITAYGENNWIIVVRKLPEDRNSEDKNDVRDNLVLYDCLKNTKRLIEQHVRQLTRSFGPVGQTDGHETDCMSQQQFRQTNKADQ